MAKNPLLFDSLRSLSSIPVLKSIFSDFKGLRFDSVETKGYSGAQFFEIYLDQKEETKKLFLKQIILSNDWFSNRTKDLDGREAQALISYEVNQIYQIFDLPYVAIAMEEGKSGFLMHDLSKCLFPDYKFPISARNEELILNKLAELHAFYWNNKDLEDLNWLHKAKDFVYLMGPLDLEEIEMSNGRLTNRGSARGVQFAIKEGWENALKLLPENVKKAILLPPEKIIETWKDLPNTLIHGDVKIANFALMPDGKLSLFDWAFVGFAPCTFDIGWYLAVNSSRLSKPKEEVLILYRQLLEKHLNNKLDDSLWDQLEEAGIVCGALMLLWNKASSVINKAEGAEQEWKWWLDKLQTWAKRINN